MKTLIALDAFHFDACEVSIDCHLKSRRQFGESFSLTDLRTVGRMTRDEIEERMDELARKYVETRDKKIIDELYELVHALEKIKKGTKQ